MDQEPSEVVAKPIGEVNETPIKPRYPDYDNDRMYEVGDIVNDQYMGDNGTLRILRGPGGDWEDYIEPTDPLRTHGIMDEPPIDLTQIRTEAPAEPTYPEWDRRNRYAAGSMVRRNGNLYRARRETGLNPTNSRAWELVPPIQTHVAEGNNYVAELGYSEGDIVRYRGNQYRALTRTALAPTDQRTWELIT